MYYAEFYEGNCTVALQPVYAIGGDDLTETPNQQCPICIVSSHRRKNLQQQMPEIPHYTRKPFPGFDPSLPATYTPKWSSGVTQVGQPVFKRIHIVGEGRIYKAKVFELQVDRFKTIYFGFEIDAFPPDENPSTIAFNNCKRCVGLHAYSMRYQNKGMLFFADVSG
jgi:hypothetical protein